MAADHKKFPAAGKEEKPASNAADAKKEIIAQEVVIKTTGNVEIIEEAHSEASSGDPLNDFKEKMNKEEQSSQQAPSRKNFMWPILFIFIAAILLLTGIFVYRQGMFKGVQNNAPVVVSPTPTVAPEPTKAPDLTKFEIEIQNGSGVAGEAGRQQASLEAEGFTVSSVGNADNSDYTDTIIQVKAEVAKEFVAKLKTVLESSFTVKEEVLSDDASTPVIVILGTKI